jgi:hypothetical protein
MAHEKLSAIEQTNELKERDNKLQRVTIGFGKLTAVLGDDEGEPQVDVVLNETGEILATISSSGIGYEAVNVIANHLGK